MPRRYWQRLANDTQAPGTPGCLTTTTNGHLSPCVMEMEPLHHMSHTELEKLHPMSKRLDAGMKC
jgi:hypothetical protein